MSFLFYYTEMLVFKLYCNAMSQYEMVHDVVM